MHPPLHRRLFIAGALLAAVASSQAIELPLPPLSPPGLPGRIDISRLPLPQVVIQAPTIIIRPPALPLPPGVVVVQPGQPTPPPPPPRTAPPPQPQPVYMWVPPGHRKDWKKHCHQYKACGVPVLFVRDDWYERHVHRGGKRDGDDDDNKRRGHGHGHGHGHGKDGKGDDKRRGKDD